MNLSPAPPPSPEDSSSVQVAVVSPMPGASHPTSHPGAAKLGRILAIVVAGFMASLFFHYELGAVKGQPYPLSTFLFRPHDQFSDFYISPRVAASFSPHEKYRVNNVGWASAVILCWTWLRYSFFYPDYDVLSLVLYTAVFLGAAFYFVRKTVLTVSPDCVWAKTLALTLCSYPVLISLDRSNEENLIFIMLGTAIFLYQRHRTLPAAVALGMAIATKPYGAVFLALFLSDRRFKEIFISLGVAATLTLLALLAYPGNPWDTFTMLHGSMSSYLDVYVIGNEGLYFCSSLYGMAKVLIYWNHWFLEGADPATVFAFMQRFMSGYFVFAVAAYALLVGLLLGVRMPLWKKAALLACSINLLPYISGAYRLMHLLVPMLLFILEEKDAWGDRFFAVIFGLILVPKSYIHFVFDPVFRVYPFEVSDCVVLDPLLMSMLVIGIVSSVLRSPVPSDAALWVTNRFRNLRPAVA